MANLIEQAISTVGDRAAQIIQDALGIEIRRGRHYVFPKTWQDDRVRGRIIGEWLQTEARFLGS
jgi:hypothetical protein